MAASFFVPPAKADKSPRSLLTEADSGSRGRGSGEGEVSDVAAASLSPQEVVEVEVATSNERDGEAAWPNRMMEMPMLEAVSEGPVAKAVAARAEQAESVAIGLQVGKGTEGPKTVTTRLGGRMGR